MIKTTWDLSQIYKTDEEFFADFEKVKKLVDEIEKFRGTLCKPNRENLLKYLKLNDEVTSVFQKLAVFAHCKKDDDGKNPDNMKKYALIWDYDSKISEKLSFVKSELVSLDEKFLNELMTDNDFKDYSRFIESLIREKKHTLSEHDEQILANVSGFVSNDNAYLSLSDIEMLHGTVKDENGKNINLNSSNYNLFLKDKNQDFRKKVMEEYLGQYKRLNLTISELYISNVKYTNFVAKLKNYKSALDMSTYDEQVDSSICKKNIEYVGSKSKLLQEYFKTKKEILGLKQFYTSDINADLPFDVQNVKYEECVEDIYEAFKPLGKDYQNMFKKALEEGWIDAFPRQNKANGGYTIHTYLIHPYILLNFDGTNYWKSAIAHEFGHAMHSYYSAKTQPYAKADYTIFVAEVASLTNEILLSEYVLQKETDKKKKMQIIADFLSLFYLNVYNSSMLAEFEIYAHETLANGESLTGQDLTQKFAEIFSRYFGDSVKFTENFEYDWERKSHIFRDYYLYKYSTGLISACAIASKILSDKTGEYVKKYKQFLSLGDSKDPVSSLKVADIDITSDETYDFAFGMFEKYLNELKEIYKGEKD